MRFRQAAARLQEERLQAGQQGGGATETIVLNENVTLHLEQRTCEYLVRTYTFILKEKPEDANVVGWQYRKAIELLSLVENRSNPKLKLANEKKALSAYAQLVVHPGNDVEINAVQPQYQFSEIVSVIGEAGDNDARIVVKVQSGPY